MLSSPVSDLTDREEEAILRLQRRRREEILDGLWLKVRYACGTKKKGTRTCQILISCVKIHLKCQWNAPLNHSSALFLCVLKGVYLRDTGDRDQEAPPRRCTTPPWTGLCFIPASLLFKLFLPNYWGSLCAPVSANKSIRPRFCCSRPLLTLRGMTLS